MRRVDGIGVILAALFAAALVGWLVNTLLPHVWLTHLAR